MSTPIEALKGQVDIHELAARLGLQRPDPKGNYRSPHHPDKSPSLQIGGRKYPAGWYDHSQGRGGDVIDLVEYVLGLETSEAIQWLQAQYGLEPPRTPRGPKRQKSLVEHIAEQSRRNPAPAIDYLVSRDIDEGVVQRAVKLGVVGYNDYTSPTKPAGTFGHGGPATAFIVRSQNPGHVVGVDLRYHDPKLNGDVKTQSHGEKVGYSWMLDRTALKRSKIVVLVESPINALTVETAVAHPSSSLKEWTALAIRGASAAEKTDLSVFHDKHVVLCMDRDEPDQFGRCAGNEAAWILHERLTTQLIPCHLVDQDEWIVNDLNDLLQAQDVGAVSRALQRFSPWAIPGVPGKFQKGRMRIFLPSADYSVYYKYRVREDFTHYAEVKEDDEGREGIQLRDLADFRIAAISEVRIASALATLTGKPDHQPTQQWAVTIQAGYYKSGLMREVVTYKKLHAIEWWKQLGAIWKPNEFLRLITIWSRATDLGRRDAVNFVGLCYRQGKLTVNEGPDCYFTVPEKQCTYHNFRFPSGDRRQAATVIRAYVQTFGQNAAAQLLTWTLGAHLKAFLSFWPHLALQGDKGTGKTTLLERLSSTTGIQILSGQSMQTEFRIITALGYTSQPICWDEISSRSQDLIDKAIALLQESYKFLVTKRGSDLTEHLLCAPVLLSGEDVTRPARSLIGKLVRVRLREKGSMLPWDLPPFPTRQWLDYLTGCEPRQVMTLHAQAVAFCQKGCRAPSQDAGAQRMVTNYAALAVAWTLLLDFAELHEAEFGFMPHLLTEMNSHIAETSTEREPWVWILEIALNEIAAGAYPYPYRIDELGSEEVLLLRTSHVMHHLATKPGLRSLYDGLPVKSDRVFKRQLMNAGVVASERADPIVKGQRVSHMIALGLSRLAEYGLFPEDPVPRSDRHGFS